ncbi:MAG: tyrosine-type recombinase/integrase [Sphingobacteriaceae bacterium]|nr:tyrosine-type recombinase/integrase [Sphingobacteriaceae bacterium]
MTFHSSRHTFSINSLLLGIKIEVVSDILGHSELSTTQRYARVVDRLREQEMDKWDKILQEEFTENEIPVICPNCENVVMKFEKGVIQLNNIPCLCQYCTKHFTFKITPMKLLSNLN